MRKAAGNSLRAASRSSARAPAASGRFVDVHASVEGGPGHVSGRAAMRGSGPSKLLLLPVDPPPRTPSPSAATAADDSATEPAIVLPASARALRTPRSLAPQRSSDVQAEAEAASAPRIADHTTPAYVRPEERQLPALPDGPSHRPPLRQRVVSAPESQDDHLAAAALASVAELAADVVATHSRSAQRALREPAEDAAEPIGQLPRASAASDRPRSEAVEPGPRGQREITTVTTAVTSAPATVELAAGSEQHFGAQLRHARVSHGLSLSDVAEKTRISPRWLVALEEAQLDVLPAPVFVSGYLRTYARLLGIDGQQLLARYQELARKRALALAPTERGFTVRRHGQPVQVPTWVIATLLCIVTVLVLAALWLVSTHWHR